MMKDTHRAEIACSLNDQEFRQRQAFVRGTLLPHLTGSERLTSGLRLTFPAALRSSVETFVDLERQCCGFLTFTVTHPDESLVLTIEGPPEAQSTLDALAARLTEE